MNLVNGGVYQSVNGCPSSCSLHLFITYYVYSSCSKVAAISVNQRPIFQHGCQWQRGKGYYGALVLFFLYSSFRAQGIRIRNRNRGKNLV